MWGRARRLRTFDCLLNTYPSRDDRLHSCVCVEVGACHGATSNTNLLFELRGSLNKDDLPVWDGVNRQLTVSAR